MKHLHALYFTIFIVCTISTQVVFSQCNINTCGVVFSADTLLYDADDQALQITNINWGQLSCYTTNMNIGLDVYIYQILPNGSRSDNCHVINSFPDNLSGYVNLDFGSNALCNYDFTIDTLNIGSEDGFYPCDGALYEVEMALFVTVDTTFLNSALTVNNHLPASEYIILNMGFVETHISNTFPGNGQPFLINELKPWGAATTDTLIVNCNQDVELFLHGQSLLANCNTLSNYHTAIASETSNIFIYSVNGASPQLLLDTTLVYAGGQLTGIEANGYCYGGILTDSAPYVFKANLLDDACNGTTVTLTLYTHDGFTNQLKTNTLTLVYKEACEATLILDDIPISASVYSAGLQITSKGTVATNDTVMMKAGERISLQNGFRAEAGTKYRAEIEPCE